MITFKHRSNSKKINIRTSKKLDERMSHWLQKVFGIKNQIIGFKSSESKYYDVQTFYLLIQKFYNSQVEIVQGNDQVEISCNPYINIVTSDNLNSSSFIRPSHQNTEEINLKGSFEQGTKQKYEEQVVMVNDKGSFERKLGDNKDFSILFDINPGFKKEIIDNVGQLVNSFSGARVTVYILLNNNSPKKSTYSIYLGKVHIVTLSLTTQYKKIIVKVVGKVRPLNGGNQPNKAIKRHEQQDEAPSFTTYHLQQRLNQDACLDYLNRMSRQKLLSNYEFHKLVQRLQDNFNDFYKIFCEGVMDNDYESFRQEIKNKVQNNLQMLLSNVEQMDLSRPISREEQRRQNIRKSVPDIEIVKVQNYFQVLDLIKDRIDTKHLGQIKQNLLDQNEQLCSYFSKFLSRQIGKQELSRKLIGFARQRDEDLRPFSRCVPRNNRAKSSDCVLKEENKDQLDDMLQPKTQEAPMFGLLSIPQNDNVSPIKNMSDIESNYRRAEDRLTKRANYFASEQYGLLYHYLQTRDDGISNLVQGLDQNEQQTLANLKKFLKQKLQQILSETFNQSQLSYLDTIRNNSNFSYIFENFKYDCDLNIFLASLKEQISKSKPQIERILHKKSSDSQLLDFKNGKQSQKRKYSDQKPEDQQQQGSPSPKASDSIFDSIQFRYIKRVRSFLCIICAHFLALGFNNLKNYFSFVISKNNRKNNIQDYLINNAILHYFYGFHNAEYFRQNLKKKQYEQKNILKIVPLFNELMRELENQGKITNKMRKWSVFSFIELNIHLIAAFQLYLLQKDQNQLIQSLTLAFESQNKDMEYFKTYMSRIEQILKEIVGHDQASVQIFKYYPDLIRSFIEIFYFNGDFEELMDSLDILQARHRKNCTISVATLNFSGINTNPFEYDDGSQMFVALNQNVKSLINKQIPNLTDWNVGKIDKNYTSTERLSVGFSSKLSTVDGRLLNRQEFNKIWREKWQKSQTKKNVASTQQQVQTNIHMDYIFYRALLKYVYKLPSFEELDSKLKTLNTEQFDSFLEQKFNRPASKLGVKADLVYEYLLKQKIDLLCLQQAGFVDWGDQLVKEYGHLKHHDSVLIYKKQKLGNIRPDLTEKYGKELDFNNDTAFLFTDRHYLIISAHLKSSKLHIEQAKSMFQTLRKIKSQHPLLKVIIGMDANHLVHHENLLDQNGNELFFLTPDKPEKPTTVKKRSFLQAQYKKSGTAVSQVKDHIVASKEISQSNIQRIDGQESKDELLPNDIHPYDHYLVCATIKFV